MKKVVIVGGGFAGIHAARQLGRREDLEVVLLDRRNHHLFQPLLYQVAMAGLSPADIAAPIRSMLAGVRNVRVYVEEVLSVDREAQKVTTDKGEHAFDFLLLACGANHTYFGHPEWETYAPGLKTIPQATEIRRRVLSAFEAAERTDDPEEQKRQLTFVVVGGGPTGVELAGAIGEMSRFTLKKDFRNIDPSLTRVMLIEAGQRILVSFPGSLASHAVRDLEKLGVQVWTNSRVTGIDEQGVTLEKESISAATVIWAAGVKASELGGCLGVKQDPQQRVVVETDLSIKGFPNIFVAGDMAHFSVDDWKCLPGVAPVAMQQGRHVAKNILRQIDGQEMRPFKYVDKGHMATIGRSRAIVQTAGIKITGWFAWMTWLVVHIYYLSGFKNRLVVLFQWAWSYWKYRRGARLIVNYTRWQQEKEPK